MNLFCIILVFLIILTPTLIKSLTKVVAYQENAPVRGRYNGYRRFHIFLNFHSSLFHDIMISSAAAAQEVFLS